MHVPAEELYADRAGPLSARWALLDRICSGLLTMARAESLRWGSSDDVLVVRPQMQEFDALVILPGSGLKAKSLPGLFPIGTQVEWFYWEGLVPATMLGKLESVIKNGQGKIKAWSPATFGVLSDTEKTL